MTKKTTYIEFLRIIAAFLVIVNHTNSFLFLSLTPGPAWFASITYFFVCKIAVPLFLFIMGALLLNKEDTPKKTAQRIVRIAAVLFAGSLVYSIFYSRLESPAFSLKHFLWTLPQENVTNAYWYLYLYLGLLLMLPILQTLVKALSKRQLEYFLLISVVFLGTVPLIPSFALEAHFTSALIGTYIGQVLLGYYIEHYISLTKKLFWICFSGFILLVTLQTFITYRLYLKDPTSFLFLDSINLITVTATAACFYICVKYLFTNHPPSPKAERALCCLGSLTFGIYLLGDLSIIGFKGTYYVLCGYIPAPLAMVIWELLAFVSCALATAVLRLIPPLRRFL